MSVTKETATVYRGDGRRYLTKSAAIHAEAKALIKAKHPSEKPYYEPQGYCSYPGFHWSSLQRSDVLLRRVTRLVRAATTKGHQ